MKSLISEVTSGILHEKTFKDDSAFTEWLHHTSDHEKLFVAISNILNSLKCNQHYYEMSQYEEFYIPADGKKFYTDHISLFQSRLDQINQSKY